MVEKRKTSLIAVAGWILLAFQIVFFLFMLHTNGGNIINYFWHDSKDTAMDFFHSIEYVKTKRPYEQFGVVYPPLANLFFYAIYAVVAGGYPQETAQSFYESICIRGTEADLRLYQAPLLVFLMFLIACVSVMIFLLLERIKDGDYFAASLFSWGLVFSYGILQCVERGNVLLLAFVFLLCFLLHYDSPNPIVREIATICLSLSFGLKLYPALFGLLLLRDKRYGQAVRAGVYGIGTMVFPLFFFEEGLGGIKLWINTMVSFNGNNDLPEAGTGMKAILYSLQKWMQNSFGFYISDRYFFLVSIIVFFALVVSALVVKKKWSAILAISLAIILVQSMGEYIYCLLVLPLYFLSVEEKCLSKHNWAPFVCLLLLNCHLPIIYSYKVSYPRATVAHLLMIILTIYTINTAIKEGQHEKLEK